MNAVWGFMHPRCASICMAEEDGDPGDEESSSMARNDALPSAREIVEDAQVRVYS